MKETMLTLVWIVVLALLATGGIVVAVLWATGVIRGHTTAELPPPGRLQDRQVRTTTAKHVVFFAWVDRNRALSHAYLKLYYTLNIPHCGLHIVLVGNEDNRTYFKSFPRLRYESLSEFTENQFEYHGIHKVWELAHQVPPGDLLAYFHNKGVTHGPVINPACSNLFFGVLGQWREVERIHREEPELAVWSFVNAARFPWFNFWWATAAVVCTLEEPKLNVPRHYYESYMSTQRKAMYSLFHGRAGVASSATEAVLAAKTKLIHSNT